MALLKLCICGKPVPIQDKRCTTCNESREDNTIYDKYRRDKKSNAFYQSKMWKVKRLEALNKTHGLCLHCMNEKRIKRAEMIDHIIPIKVDWSLRLMITNLQPLCNVHHNAKTALDRQKYKG